jgi:hypothetical protein
LLTIANPRLLLRRDWAEGWGASLSRLSHFGGSLKPTAPPVAENLCLRDADRQFWICASRRFADWRHSLLIVKPEPVLRWHRQRWRTYWSWLSNRQRRRSGRQPIPQDLQALIGRMDAEDRLWTQRRIQAELATLGFGVSARTVAKYMSHHDRGPSPGWREFLERPPSLFKRNRSSASLAIARNPSASRSSSETPMIRHPNAEIANTSSHPRTTNER